MSTRSRIGYQFQDGSILSIYCHYDGYPAFNGVKLRENFNTDKEVRELIDLGDISCLWTNAGWNNETLPEIGPLTYSSRGEDGIEPVLSKNQREFIKSTKDSWAEFAYVYRNGKWFCYDQHGKAVKY